MVKLAKWLRVCLRTKWFWVRVQLGYTSNVLLLKVKKTACRSLLNVTIRQIKGKRGKQQLKNYRRQNGSYKDLKTSVYKMSNHFHKFSVRKITFFYKMVSIHLRRILFHFKTFKSKCSGF